MKLTFSKKAGLQMSINAIVVLVMAMVVLGLGLGFIRNMIGGAEDKFIGAISNIDLTNPPSRTNPITFESSTMKVKKGDSKEFIYSIYNTEGNTINNVELEISDCVPAGATFEIDSMGANIGDGDYVSFKGLLRAPDEDTASAGTYVCTTYAAGSTGGQFASTQLTIKLES